MRDHSLSDVCKPDGCKPDRCKPDGCKPDGCKPDGCKPDGCKPDRCKPDRCKPDLSTLRIFHVKMATSVGGGGSAYPYMGNNHNFDFCRGHLLGGCPIMIAILVGGTC